MACYKGTMLYEAILSDIFFKKIGPKLFMAPGAEREKLLAEVKGSLFPEAMATIEKHLPTDKKFINGDSLTTHDFTVGGVLLNVFDNPTTKDPAMWAEIKASLSPRITK